MKKALRFLFAYFIIFDKNLFDEFLDHDFILDGCSFHYAHIWSKSGISICLRHFVASKESSNLREKIVKDLFYTCARCVEVPSYISTMVLKKQEQIVKRSEAIYRYGNR